MKIVNTVSRISTEKEKYQPQNNNDANVLIMKMSIVNHLSRTGKKILHIDEENHLPVKQIACPRIKFDGTATHQIDVGSKLLVQNGSRIHTQHSLENFQRFSYTTTAPPLQEEAVTTGTHSHARIWHLTARHTLSLPACLPFSESH